MIHRLRMRAWRTVLLCSTMLTAAPPRLAHAQQSAQHGALARSLFDQALALMEGGSPKEACPKLEESQRLDPGLGTQFHLARCYEAVGRTASAWSLYLTVASAAKTAGQTDRAQVARDHARDIEPKVPRLLVQVPEASRAQDLEIVVDDVALGQPMWSTPMPFDPGPHRVQARAPGRTAWNSSVNLPAGGGVTTVTVPVLEGGASPPEPTPPAVSPPQPTPTPVAVQPRDVAAPDQPASWGMQKTSGVIVAGAGLVMTGISVALAGSAKSRYDEASPYCDGNVCYQEGTDLRESALSRGNAATVVGVIGLAALATGGVLFFTAPREPKPGQRAAVNFGMGPGSVMLKARW